MVFRVHFRRENRTIHVGSDTNLRKACLSSGLDPYPLLGGLLSCRGKGFCGKHWKMWLEKKIKDASHYKTEKK